MTALAWDQVGERFYETGVDHGVLYIPDNTGAYVDGVAWNGLTTVTESPTGAEANAQYADNIKYLNLYSAEQFGATVEAYTYPDEFTQFDGMTTPTPGVVIGQQARKSFGLCYRTKIGNDLNEDLGYKLHLVYGCTAAPSEKAFNTINDSPEAIAFSWAISTIPVLVTGMRPTSLITIDSTKVDAGPLAALEEILYGSPGVDPALPLPDTVIAMFEGTALVTGVVVAGGVDHVVITGTTTNYLFTVQHWDGDEFVTVVGGNRVNEAAAEALTLTDGIQRVILSAATGYYVPAAQQDVWEVATT